MFSIAAGQPSGTEDDFGVEGRQRPGASQPLQRAECHADEDAQLGRAASEPRRQGALVGRGISSECLTSKGTSEGCASASRGPNTSTVLGPQARVQVWRANGYHPGTATLVEGRLRVDTGSSASASRQKGQS